MTFIRPYLPRRETETQSDIFPSARRLAERVP